MARTDALVSEHRQTYEIYARARGLICARNGKSQSGFADVYTPKSGGLCAIIFGGVAAQIFMSRRARVSGVES